MLNAHVNKTIDTEKIPVAVINDIIGKPYQLIPATKSGYCVAEDKRVYWCQPGEVDHLPYNKKASALSTGNFCYQVVGTAVYCKMKDLEFVDGRSEHPITDSICQDD